jgi:DNA-binding transcriptional ArsR family regulator
MSLLDADEIAAALRDQATSGHQKNAIMSIIAQRIDHAYAGTKAELQELDHQLVAAFRQVFVGSAPDVRSTLMANENKDDSELMQAFRLGQLSFAQELVSMITAHRAEDDFIPRLQAESVKPVVTALKDGLLWGMTRIQLVEATGLDESAVTVQIQELKEIGAVDFRYGSQNVEYFLTPVAESVVKNKKET